MSATKQDYEAIAAALRGETQQLTDIIGRMPSRQAADCLINQRIGIACAAEVIADHFAKNPKFNRADFLRNCGVQS